MKKLIPLLLLCAACVPTPRPHPVPVPPPAPKVFRLQVLGDDRQPVNQIGGRLVRFDGLPGVECPPETYDTLACTLPADLDYGALFTGHFTGQDHQERVQVIEAKAETQTVWLESQRRFLPPLERRGQFYYQNGQPFTLIGASEFTLYARFLNGEDIRPVLQELHDIGFNYARVWLLNTSIGRIVPSDYGPLFYARLRDFVGLLGHYGLYAELTVFTMPRDLLTNLGAQQAHYDQVVTALGDAFVFIEGQNEVGAYPANAVFDGLRWWKPAGATFDLSVGSTGSDGDALEPVIDSCRYHSNDANEWWRRQAHNGFEQAEKFGKPCWADENTRPDRDSNVNHYYDAAAGAALLSAGSTFHSLSGRSGQTFSAQDLPAARAHVAGAKSINLAVRELPYARRDDLNGTDNLRVYQRGPVIVPIRK